MVHNSAPRARRSELSLYGWAVRRLPLLLVVAAAASLAAAGQHSRASTAGAESDPAVLSMLVMGDSYSAGNGAGSYYGAAGCFRSAYNYARQYERKVEAAPYNQRGFVENIACSGATTDAFSHTTSGRSPQLDAVNAGYDIIFLTIGGNDLHFADIAKFCLIAATRDGANCGSNLSRAESMIKDGTIYTKIVSVLKAIELKADSRTKIVLLGYPYLEGDPNYRLRSGHFGNTFIDVGKRVRALGDEGDSIQKQIVNELNTGLASKPFVFVSVQELFAGPPVHELYAQKTNPDRWMVQPGVDASRATWQTYYHPNPTGWTHEAALLVSDSQVPKHPAVAPAPLPSPVPPSRLIVIGTSIGGVRLGMARADLLRLLGQPDRHEGTNSTLSSYSYDVSGGTLDVDVNAAGMVSLIATSSPLFSTADGTIFVGAHVTGSVWHGFGRLQCGSTPSAYYIRQDTVRNVDSFMNVSDSQVTSVVVEDTGVFCEN